MKTKPVQIFCIQTVGMRPTLVTIEVSSHFQVPQLLIIGLPSTEIGESKERVRSAILNSGFEFPNRRVIVNLSPAFLTKSGTGMDLGIALGILLKHSEQPIHPSRILAWGELSLSGDIQATPHSLHALYSAMTDLRIEWILIPKHSSLPLEFLTALQSRFPIRARTLRMLRVDHLKEAYLGLMNTDSTQTLTEYIESIPKPTQRLDPDEMLSLPSTKLTRILGATLAGEHHLMMLGPKGVGKSHSIEIISKCFENQSQDSVIDRALTSDLYTHTIRAESNIRFVGVQIKPSALQGSFRSSKFQPGECSLAHGGLLIGDEFPEWSRDSKECLRHPLERGMIPVNRVDGSFEVPTRFQFIASGNLCPCGGSPWENPPTCICKLPERERYRHKLSGPILDRIDFFLLVSKHSPEGKMKVSEFKRKIAEVKSRLIDFHGVLPVRWTGEFIENSLKPTMKPELLSTLERISSVRSQHKVLKSAHTLAAWDGIRTPEIKHIHEATQLRPEQWV